MWVHKNMHNPAKVKMDTNCDLIWVTSLDWEVLDQAAKESSIIRNPLTNTRPAIIHVVGLKTYEDVYERAYQSITRSS